MDYKFLFASDNIIKNKAYPALSKWSALPYTDQWRQFGQHWPYTVPCELHEHCRNHNFLFEIENIKDCHGPENFYSVGLGFFDFSIDYLALIPPDVFARNLTVLFYYHEGDNPYKIKQRLDQLCQIHGLPTTCYLFISGNTSANNIPRFAWFPDHELLYWHRNKQVPATTVHADPRSNRFTVLNRTHKWWRATVMTDLQRSGILDHCQWSYNTQLSQGDSESDNPIQIDLLDLRAQVYDFLKTGPYNCDEFTSDQHNDHHLHVSKLYTQSYCHIVLETHFDADQSGGAFLTEKTFKPIKHGQPFVIVGPPGSLQALRDLGYRTFDHVIDNSYDLVKDHTQRWMSLLKTIKHINNQNMHAWFELCRPDIEHNQQHFLASKHDRLNTLYDKLLHQLATS